MTSLVQQNSASGITGDASRGRSAAPHHGPMVQTAQQVEGATAHAMTAPGPIRRSAPIPWHIMATAERAVLDVQVGFEDRSIRLRAALGRAPAHNKIAVERLFSACEAALRPDIVPVRHSAERHHALTATALSPLRPRAANDNEPAGIVVQQLLCLAGKRLDWREVAPALEVSCHALGRFIERSGCLNMSDLSDAIWAAADAADLMLLTHCETALWRLAGGVAAVLLPAGNGAFLGHLRILPDADGKPMPVIEAQTWLHEGDLCDAQRDVWEVMSTGLPCGEMLRHLPSALRGLRTAARGDRRLREGLQVLAPGTDPGWRFQMALGCSQPVALARMRAGLACADTIAVERRGR